MKKTIASKRFMKAGSVISAVLLATSLVAVPAFADSAENDGEIKELKEVARIPDDAYAEMLAMSPRLSSNESGEHLSIHVKENGERVIARSATDTEFACDFKEYTFSQTEARAKENATSTYVNVTYQEKDTPKWAFRVLGNHRYAGFTNETLHGSAFCETKGEALIYQNVYENYDEFYPNASRANCKAKLQTIRLENRGSVSGVWSPDSVYTHWMPVLNP